MRQNIEELKDLHLHKISNSDSHYRKIKDKDSMWIFVTASDAELLLIEPEEVIGLTRGDC